MPSVGHHGEDTLSLTRGTVRMTSEVGDPARCVLDLTREIQVIPLYVASYYP
jgi:hypothetical protein